MSNVVFELFAKLGLDSSEYEKGLDKSKSLAGSVGGAIGNGLKTAAKISVAAIGTATAAVGAFAASSVKTGADFDKSMSQVAATMGFTTEQLNATEEQLASMSEEERNAAIVAQESFGQLRDYAQEMGRTTAFSASQASEALNYMALAGYDVETSMTMLPNVLNLAAAGNMDLATASDMVTDAQSALGLTLEETAEMVDQMAKASSKSNTSVSQLGEAMLTIGATARGVKGGTVELSTVLGILADNGIKGAEGGTHLRNAILSLQTPTKDGIAALEQLGMTYDDMYDASGNLRSLPEIFQEMSTAMEGMTQQSKDAIISGVFNKTDLAAVNALIGTNAKRWDEVTAAIEDSEGAAQAMADTQLDNLAGDITLFQSALEGAKIAVSDGLTPSLRQFVQFGTNGLSRITDAFQKGGISGAMAEFGTILSDGLAMVTEKIPDFVNAGMELLGAIGRGLAENTDVILDAAVQTVDNIMQAMLNATEGGGEDSFVLGFLGKLANTFIENGPRLISMGIQILENIITGIATSLPNIIPTAIEVILTLVTSLLDNVDLLIDSAIALITGLAEGLINALPILLEKAPEIIAKLVEAIIINLPKLMVASAEIITKLAVGIFENLPKMLEAGMNIMTSIVTGIARLYLKMQEAGKEAINKVRDGIKSIDPVKWGQDLIDSFVRGIRDRISRVAEVAKEVAGTIKEFLGFSEPESGPLADFHTFAPDMMQLFAQGIKDNEHLITDQIEKSFDFGDMITSADVSSFVATSSYQNDIMRLLEEIAANKDVHIVLDGGLDRLFRAMQTESRRNRQITGQESFA